KRGPYAGAVIASTPGRHERSLRMAGSCGTLESLSIRSEAMTRRFTLILLTILACVTPRTSLTAMTPQAEQAVDYRPTDEQVAYGIMAASAMKQSRFLTQDKTVGLYQSDDPRHPLHPIVQIVLEDNKFREIHKGQMQV